MLIERKELRGDGVPIRRGYTIHQTHLDELKASIIGVSFTHLLDRRKVSNENERYLESFLDWVKETYDPKLIYYPFPELFQNSWNK